MYIVIIAWMYVAVMMAVAEAVAPNGSVFGAIVTFALYGLLPAGLLAYILSTPARKAKRKAQELAELEAATRVRDSDTKSDAGSALDPNPKGHTAR